MQNSGGGNKRNQTATYERNNALLASSSKNFFAFTLHEERKLIRIQGLVYVRIKFTITLLPTISFKITAS